MAWGKNVVNNIVGGLLVDKESIVYLVSKVPRGVTQVRVVITKVNGGAFARAEFVPGGRPNFPVSL